MSDRRPMEESEAIGPGETLRVIGRAIRYVGPFRGRFAVKVGLLLLSLLPMLMLPWPVKIIIDNVIEGHPIADPIRPYPALVAPLMNAVSGYSPYELLFLV
ncbi:MAG: hypothetical protein NZ990_03525, partial [Myxococcota bacterium]|nr:hypothetical protein [Myxococcota bacterium]